MVSMQPDKSSSSDRKVRRKQSAISSSPNSNLTSFSSSSTSSSKKESTRGDSNKKEIRSSSSSSNKTSSSHNSSSVKSNEPTINVTSVTMAALEYEEKESLSHDPEQDAQTFNETCELIRHQMAEMQIRRKECNVESDPDFNARKLEVAMAFLELKRLNRFDKIRCKHARDLVTEEKQQVDSFHLQLQNLMYEVLHLQKEINKCLEFKSRDETIELVDLEQFFREAPEEVTQPLKESEDLHRCTLARLEWELEQRKKLASTLESQMRLKETILEDIEKEKRRLESLRPILMNIVQAAQPLQSQLGIPLQSSDNQHENAPYLSRPMYILYVNACAMKEAYHENFTITINGNVDEAKATYFSHIIEDEESAESDVEDRKAKRHRKSKTDKKESMMRKLLSAHPLSISMHFTAPETGRKLIVEFFHMIGLGIITVKSSLVGPHDINRGTLLNPHILDNLIEKDEGLVSPNPANDYQLRTLRIANFNDLCHKIGYSYKWAQTLAGLNFLSRTEDERKGNVLMFTTVIEAIKDRFNSRIGLHQVILELECGSISLPTRLIPPSRDKLNCSIKEWRPSDLDEWLKHPTGKNMASLNLIDGSEHFFKMTVVRGSAFLKTLIAIPNDYPLNGPVFQIMLNSARTSSTDTELRDLECKVNVDIVETIDSSDRTRILTLQVYNLCIGFDSICANTSKLNFPDEPMRSPEKRFRNSNNEMDYV